MIPPDVINFIDPSATIGTGTKVWWFAVVLSDAVIGDHCNIGSHCEIGRGSVIGNNSRLSHGVFLPPKSRIGSNVFLGPGVIMCDDWTPVAGNKDYNAAPPIVEDHVSVGAGAIILPGVTIGHHAMIGAGAIVTKDVHANTVLRGDPSRITRCINPQPFSSLQNK